MAPSTAAHLAHHLFQHFAVKLLQLRKLSGASNRFTAIDGHAFTIDIRRGIAHQKRGKIRQFVVFAEAPERHALFILFAKLRARK